MGDSLNDTQSESLPIVLAAVPVAIGILVLFGWVFGLPLLTTFMPEHSATQPLSAVLILLAAFALQAWSAFRHLLISRLLAGLCLSLSLVALLMQGATIGFGIDQLFFSPTVRQQANYAYPGWPSVPTACAFAVLAAAILSVPFRQRWVGFFCSAASTIGVIITLVSLLGHLFGLTEVTAALGFTQMALPTTLGVGALSIAILVLRDDAGWMRLLSGTSVGATVGRWLLPVIVIVPVAVAWLAVIGAQSGLYSASFTAILITVTTVVLLGAFTVWGAAQLNELEGVRRTANDLRRSEAALRIAEERQRMLANELHHRVKNSLTVVQAIAHQTFKQPADIDRAKALFADRLRSLAGAHDLLMSEEAGGSSLRDVIRRSIEGGCGFDAERTRLSGPDVHLSSRQTLALSMIVHELCTNAVKYGALSNDRGTITVSWDIQPSAAGKNLKWIWQEAGGPAVQPRERKGFGSKLIERIMSADLNGAATMEFAPAGLRCRVEAPLDAA